MHIYTLVNKRFRDDFSIINDSCTAQERTLSYTWTPFQTVDHQKKQSAQPEIVSMRRSEFLHKSRILVKFIITQRRRGIGERSLFLVSTEMPTPRMNKYYKSSINTRLIIFNVGHQRRTRPRLFVRPSNQSESVLSILQDHKLHYVTT